MRNSTYSVDRGPHLQNLQIPGPSPHGQGPKEMLSSTQGPFPEYPDPWGHSAAYTKHSEPLFLAISLALLKTILL